MKDASIIVGASMDYMKGWIITTLWNYDRLLPICINA